MQGTPQRHGNVLVNKVNRVQCTVEVLKRQCLCAILSHILGSGESIDFVLSFSLVSPKKDKIKKQEPAN